jgi:hypothetical protein
MAKLIYTVVVDVGRMDHTDPVRRHVQDQQFDHEDLEMLLHDALYNSDSNPITSVDIVED